MDKLTATQARALDFIRDHIEREGAPPTLREICQHMGYRAVGSAQDLVHALRRKGFLEEGARQAARALRLTAEGQHHGGLVEKVGTDVLTVPVLGSVPAGDPAQALEERVGFLPLSRSLLPRPLPRASELFALTAKGDSMIGAGILDGDLLVVRRRSEASPGAIVVARLEGDATVKRLMQDRRGWFLKAENPRFPARYAADSAFEIIGQVIALQRAVVS